MAYSYFISCFLLDQEAQEEEGELRHLHLQSPETGIFEILISSSLIPFLSCNVSYPPRVCHLFAYLVTPLLLNYTMQFITGSSGYRHLFQGHDYHEQLCERHFRADCR